MKNKLNIDYFTYTKDIFISILFLTPFIILYEAFFNFLYYNESQWSRNSAEIYISDFFHLFKSYSLIVELVFFFIILLLAAYINKNKFNSFKIKPTYLFMLMLEGFILGLILVIFINDLAIFQNFQSTISSNALLKSLCDGISAGIWEEIRFRAILLNIALYVVKYLFKDSKILPVFISILFISILFSLFHHYGFIYESNGEPFILNIFIRRLTAGIYLGYLYYYRGLGAACMCHISYNFILDALKVGN